MQTRDNTGRRPKPTYTVEAQEEREKGSDRERGSQRLYMIIYLTLSQCLHNEELSCVVIVIFHSVQFIHRHQISAHVATCKYQTISSPLHDHRRTNWHTQENPLNSAWSLDDNWPCTGVNVGCSRVNSSSKLLVSALPFYSAQNSVNELHHQGKIDIRSSGSTVEESACSPHHPS